MLNNGECVEMNQSVICSVQKIWRYYMLVHKVLWMVEQPILKLHSNQAYIQNPLQVIYR